MRDAASGSFGPLGVIGTTQPLRTVPAVRWRDGVAASVDEPVIEETPIALVFNQVTHAVMMATPTDLHDFAIGFALTEELVPSAAAITHFEIVRHAGGVELQMIVDAALGDQIADRSRRMTGRTGCGICGADSVAEVLKSRHEVQAGAPMRGAALHLALEALGRAQTLNAAAGAVHAAGWADADGTLRLVREDVGRHNALDKLIGAHVRAGLDPASGFVVVTSRASFEMVQKTSVLGGAAAGRDLRPDGAGCAGGRSIGAHPRRLCARRGACGLCPPAPRRRLAVSAPGRRPPAACHSGCAAGRPCRPDPARSRAVRTSPA